MSKFVCVCVCVCVCASVKKRCMHIVCTFKLCGLWGRDNSLGSVSLMLVSRVVRKTQSFVTLLRTHRFRSCATRIPAIPAPVCVCVCVRVCVRACVCVMV